MNWIELPPGSYSIVPDQAKHSHCQIEVRVRYVQSESRLLVDVEFV
jgi:hypothetical protein